MSDTPHPDIDQQDNAGFAGTLRHIQLNDIIQMCCLAASSLCIRVRQDQSQGVIYIQDGDIVHAESQDSEGEEAFFTILSWQRGSFETLDATAIEKRTIQSPCQFLLMEAARRADEMAETLGQEATPAENGDDAAQDMACLRVLIVDDSPIMCKILTSMLAADPQIEVVGTAKNGEEALEQMRMLSPDLITMDVNMPVMDGSTALKHIMIQSPCPVLIMSNIGTGSYDTILNFLNLGAVDFMSKPVKSHNIVLQQQRMVDRVHLAAGANVSRFRRRQRKRLAPQESIVVDTGTVCEQLVILVSGTGGFSEMAHVVAELPDSATASALSLQSIPPQFSPVMAAYLNARSRFEVVALDGRMPLAPGRCYVHPVGQPIDFSNSGSISVQPKPADKSVEDNRDDTWIDQLLSAAAVSFGENLTVVLVSGADLGNLQGIKQVRNNGGRIVAQRLQDCILAAPLIAVKNAELVDEEVDPANWGTSLTSFFQ